LLDCVTVGVSVLVGVTVDVMVGVIVGVRVKVTDGVGVDVGGVAFTMLMVPLMSKWNWQL
jgi:hypothetical protein